MAERVPFLLRLDPEVFAALRRWANDDLRSLNAEVEFLLRRSLRETNRLPAAGDSIPAIESQPDGDSLPQAHTQTNRQ
jgi:hypothetical protein